MARKQAEGSSVVEAVAKFLDGLNLNGAQKPLASVARLLAESLEAAPEYARARLARELHDLLTEFDAHAARESELEERRAKRSQQRAWASDG
jgi:hypothetical protein